MTKLTVRFADKEYEDLTLLSKMKERSLNELIREAVREYVKRETPGFNPVGRVSSPG